VPRRIPAPTQFIQLIKAALFFKKYGVKAPTIGINQTLAMSTNTILLSRDWQFECDSELFLGDFGEVSGNDCDGYFEGRILFLSFVDLENRVFLEVFESISSKSDFDEGYCDIISGSRSGFGLVAKLSGAWFL
jgi:hypothetical protein